MICDQGDLCNNQGGKPTTTYSCYTGISKRNTRKGCGSCTFGYSQLNLYDLEYWCNRNTCENTKMQNGQDFTDGECMDSSEDSVECCCEGRLCNGQFENPRIFSCYTHDRTNNHRLIDNGCLSCTTAVYGRGVAYSCRKMTCEWQKTPDGIDLVKNGCVDASTKDGSSYRDCCCEGNLCNAQFKPTNLFTCYDGPDKRKAVTNCGSCSHVHLTDWRKLVTEKYICKKNTCGNSKAQYDSDRTLKKGKCQVGWPKYSSSDPSSIRWFEECCCEENFCNEQFEIPKSFSCYVGFQKRETMKNCVSCSTYTYFSDGRFIDTCERRKCSTINSNFASVECFYDRHQRIGDFRACCCEGDLCTYGFDKLSPCKPIPEEEGGGSPGGGTGMFSKISVLVSAFGGIVLIGEISF